MLPNGTVWLCSNVPLTNTYDNTIDFSNATEQYNYFFSKVVKTIEEKVQYIRKGSSLEVDFKLDDIKGVNYLFYKSTKDSKIHYCFVTKKTYINENATRLDVELDVMETYQFDYKINPSYVSREHVDRWDNNLDPIFSITDEGLDYGEDYITEKAYKVDKGQLMWFLVTLKAGDPIKRYAEAGNNPANVAGLQPYIEVLVPLNFENHKIGASSSYSVKDSALGESFMINDFTDFVYRLSNTALGNYIMEISYVPYLPCTYTLEGTTLQLDGRVWQTLIQFDDGTTKVNMLGVTYKGKAETLVSFPHLWGVARAKKTQWDEVKKNPLNHRYDKRFESKLLCYPYRYNLLTNWRDTPVLFKNEFLPEDVKIKMSKVFGYNAPCRYWVHNYKDEELGRSNSLVETASLDFPIPTDQYQEYLLQNKNTLKAMVTNIQIDVASGGINGAINGASGGGIGALIGGLTGAGNAATSGAQKLLSEQAKQKDLRNLPTSYVNSYDSSHSVYDDNLYLTFYRYRISEDAQDRIAYYWHMYGYKSGRVKTPDIRSRNRFNYIQTIGANITGNFDQEDITKIQSIFDRGITFWHYSKTNFRPLNYAYGNYETRLL